MTSGRGLPIAWTGETRAERVVSAHAIVVEHVRGAEIAAVEILFQVDPTPVVQRLDGGQRDDLDPINPQLDEADRWVLGPADMEGEVIPVVVLQWTQEPFGGWPDRSARSLVQRARLQIQLGLRTRPGVDAELKGWRAVGQKVRELGDDVPIPIAPPAAGGVRIRWEHGRPGVVPFLPLVATGVRLGAGDLGPVWIAVGVGIDNEFAGVDTLAHGRADDLHPSVAVDGVGLSSIDRGPLAGITGLPVAAPVDATFTYVNGHVSYGPASWGGCPKSGSGRRKCSNQ